MASADLFIRAGDISPVFTDTILDQNGNAYNLTGKTVTFTLRSLQSSSAVTLAGTASVTNATTGAVQFTWGANDTTNAGAGLFNAEWRVVTDGYTFPNNGYRTISIEQPLASAPQLLVSIADAKEYLNIGSTTTGEDEKLLRFIQATTPVIENLAGPIIPRTYDEWHDGGQYWIKLRRRPSFAMGTSPILNILACEEYRGPIRYTLSIIPDPTAASIYSCMLDPRLGVVYRRTTGGGVIPFGAGPWGGGMPDAVHVIYQAGQSTVPANVSEAALELIRVNFQRTQQANRAPGPYPVRDEGADLGPGVPMGFLVPGRVRELLSPNKRYPSLA